MDEFKNKDIPLSVAVVDMDWHMVDDPQVPHAGWTGYTQVSPLFKKQSLLWRPHCLCFRQ